MAIEATYTIGNLGGSYRKVYDGTKLQANAVSYEGILDDDSFRWQITDDNIKHAGKLVLKCDTGYPQIWRGSTNVTSEYTLTQVQPTVSGVDTSYFEIYQRDITLQSANLTKEYDGTALTAYSQAGGTDVTDLTAGLTDKGYVSGEEFAYTFTGSQLFVGSSDNTFTIGNSATALTSDYNDTLQYGKLTVTARTVPVTITVEDQEWLYDGTTSQFNTSAYTVSGELAYGDSIYVTLSNGGKVDAGTYTDGITATYKIVHSDGTDVTDMYANVTVDAGDLKIDQRSITLTSATDTKSYDGTPLTNKEVKVTGDGFVGSEGATYNVTGSQTEVGTSKNTFSYTLKEGTKADNYAITTVEGNLTVTPAELVITVGTSLTTGLEYLYDNTATKTLVENSSYIVSGLAEGDKLTDVTITTNSSNAGIYDEDAYTLSYKVVDAAGNDVSGSYIITENKNDVEITKRTITITADSASKVYDGTALTCGTYTVTQGATEAEQLLAGETVTGVGFTADSTITHAGSTANKVDASNVTIKKADGSDSSMNYNILTEDGTLTVTQRGVLLQSTSAEKYYDGTALQNRQVIITGFHYNQAGEVVVDENAGFLAGDGCTYDFVNDNVVIDKDGNIIAWTVSEQSDTAYGQTEVGTSKNEFNYNNFTSVKYGSFESDYIIIYGGNQESLGLSKDEQDLFGDLTVWGGPVDINMTDYSWTYDYQAKTNGYFDDGYTVKVTTNEAGTESVETTVAHNSEGEAIALLGSDTIVVTVTGEDGSAETGKVQHVGANKQNEASYTIYRNGVDVTEEVEEYYQISIDGGLLQITPRTVYITSGSAIKVYDGTALTDNTVIEGSEGRDTGFIFGEGAAYEVTGSQTEVGASANTFAITKLLTDTKAADYNFVMNEGSLIVTEGEDVEVVSTTAGDFKSYGCAFQVLSNGQGLLRSAMTSEVVAGKLENVENWQIVGTGNFNGNAEGKEGLLWQDLTTGELVMQNDMTSFAEVNNKTNVLGAVSSGYTALTTGDFSGNGMDGALIQTPEVGDISVSTSRGLACFAREESGDMFVGWLGALVNTWDDGVALKGDLTSKTSINQDNYRYEVVAVGDFNGDGRDDVMLQNTMPTAVTEDGVAYEITGSGDLFTFLTGDEEAIKRGDNPTVCYAGKATDGWEVLGVGDFDSDGDADVLLGKVNTDGTTTLAGWQMKNGQQQETFGLGTMAANQDFIGIADFNNDGTDDLLISTAVTGANDKLDAWTIKETKVTGSLAIA